MKKYTWAVALMVAALATGCAAPNVAIAANDSLEAGQSVTLTGRLALKGSAPMVTPVLTSETGERWDLTTVPQATAARLQNKRVTVEGKVVRAVATPMLRRSLAVTSITLAQ
jgi:hypothetical protein